MTKVLCGTPNGGVNLVDKSAIEGNTYLFILKLKARRNVKFNLKITDGFLVDKNLSTAWLIRKEEQRNRI
ncbi:hypothetical protein [Hanamia caeni]|uniref:hypothetical protein n=1 Tax=Hanamia caeni TaxID=2294116 RepID=UPI001314E5E1|nr:hypothetical protein [Hanamia caeni]